VESETEDKRADLPPESTWRIRKEESLAVLKNTEDIGVLMVWLGDSVMYLYTEPMEVIGCLREHQVDAVFIEAVMGENAGIQFLFELRERYPDIPVFILADSDEYEDDALWNDATGYLIRPISEDDLRNVMRSTQG
jgi:two-component SAPR family response regulator